jgi:hypothetical protein
VQSFWSSARGVAAAGAADLEAVPAQHHEAHVHDRPVVAALHLERHHERDAHRHLAQVAVSAEELAHGLERHLHVHDARDDDGAVHHVVGDDAVQVVLDRHLEGRLAVHLEAPAVHARAELAPREGLALVLNRRGRCRGFGLGRLADDNVRVRTPEAEGRQARHQALLLLERDDVRREHDREALHIDVRVQLLEVQVRRHLALLERITALMSPAMPAAPSK